MDKRISKDEYYLSIAAAVARRSTCLRRQYGAVIIKNDEIISTGYNGAARGEPNCCDTGECWREANNIPHGEQYEKCVAVHAEQNAIISAARHEMLGSVLYLAGLILKSRPFHLWVVISMRNLSKATLKSSGGAIVKSCHLLLLSAFQFV